MITLLFLYIFLSFFATFNLSATKSPSTKKSSKSSRVKSCEYHDESEKYDDLSANISMSEPQATPKEKNKRHSLRDSFPFLTSFSLRSSSSNRSSQEFLTPPPSRNELKSSSSGSMSVSWRQEERTAEKKPSKKSLRAGSVKKVRGERGYEEAKNSPSPQKKVTKASSCDYLPSAIVVSRDTAIPEELRYSPKDSADAFFIDTANPLAPLLSNEAFRENFCKESNQQYDIPPRNIISMNSGPSPVIVSCTKEMAFTAREKIIYRSANPGQKLLLEGHTTTIHFLAAFSMEGCPYLLSATDKEVFFWDVTSATVRFKLSSHSSKDISCLSISKDKSKIVLGFSDGTIELYENFSGTHVLTIKASDKPIKRALVSSTGILFVLDKNNLYAWNVDTSSLIWTINEHFSAFDSCSDGSCLITGEMSGIIKIWLGNSFSGWECQHTMHHKGEDFNEVPAVAMSLNGKYAFSLATASLFMWKTDGTFQQKMHLEKSSPAFSNNFPTLTLSEDNLELMLFTQDGVLQRWKRFSDAYRMDLSIATIMQKFSADRALDYKDLVYDEQRLFDQLSFHLKNLIVETRATKSRQGCTSPKTFSTNLLFTEEDSYTKISASQCSLSPVLPEK